MSFSKEMRKLQKQLEINKLQLNGSFQHSLFAVDIDYYEKTNNRSAVARTIRRLPKTHLIVQVIKVQPRDGDKRTFGSAGKAADYIKDHPGHIAWVRVEGMIMFMLYPLACSVIYDFARHTGTEILHDVLEKVAKKKYGAYKLCKRGLSIAKLLDAQGVPIDTKPFEAILDDQRLGVMNLHATHLHSIKQFKNKLPKERVLRMLTTIAEDLRRLQAPMNAQKLFDEVNATAKARLA